MTTTGFGSTTGSSAATSAGAGPIEAKAGSGAVVTHVPAGVQSPGMEDGAEGCSCGGQQGCETGVAVAGLKHAAHASAGLHDRTTAASSNATARFLGVTTFTPIIAHVTSQPASYGLSTS